MVKAMEIHILYVWEHVNMSNPDILGNLEKQDVYSPQVVMCYWHIDLTMLDV